MNYEKKQITKEDGRTLVYYHFPESASPAQAEAFRSAEQFSAAAGVPANTPAESADAASRPEDKPRV